MKTKKLLLTIITISACLGLAWFIQIKWQHSDSTYSPHSGDVAEFFSKQAEAYGGKPNVKVPFVQMEWRVKGDSNGFQMLFDSKYIPQFKKYLFEAYGETELHSSYPQIVYNAKDVGVRILCDLGSNPAHVICLRSNSP
jgi:hypothetical protein